MSSILVGLQVANGIFALVHAVQTAWSSAPGSVKQETVKAAVDANIKATVAAGASISPEEQTALAEVVPTWISGAVDLFKQWGVFKKDEKPIVPVAIALPTGAVVPVAPTPVSLPPA